MYKKKINTTFINTANSKTSDPHRLLLNLTGKIDLRKKTNILLYQILVFTIHVEILKSHIKIINLKYQSNIELRN